MKIWQKQRRTLIYALAGFGAFALALTAACSGSSESYDGGSAVATPSGGVAVPAGPDVGPLAVGSAQSDLGAYLTGPEGRTLYVFTKDAPNTSNCKDGCVAVWPPLLVSEGQSVKADPSATGKFSSIITPAGKQVTYNSAPVYYYAGDSKPGDTTGHLVGGNWFVARPDTASTAIVGVHDAGDADYLVGPNGMSLYFFANDSAGVSNCSGQCIKNWPALTVPNGQEPTTVETATGAKAVITRADDGTRQMTYNGLPLYFFAGDKLPGETTGDGVGGVWKLARP